MLKTNNLINIKIATIHNTRKVLQLKDAYILDILTLSYLLRLTIFLDALQMFIRIIQDKSKLDNLLYQKHV